VGIAAIVSSYSSAYYNVGLVAGPSACLGLEWRP
jgi:hypothetical protein